MAQFDTGSLSHGFEPSVQRQPRADWRRQRAPQPAFGRSKGIDLKKLSVANVTIRPTACGDSDSSRTSSRCLNSCRGIGVEFFGQQQRFGYSHLKLQRGRCTLQIRNSSINLTVSISYGPSPGWRNWQTQRTQNPPVLGTLGVRFPLPAPRFPQRPEKPTGDSSALKQKVGSVENGHTVVKP